VKNLYEKSKISFALTWIISYVIGASCTDELSRLVNIEKSITVIFLGIMSAVAILWMKKNDLFREFGVCKAKISPKRLLYYIPLIVISSCNLWFGVTVNYKWYITVFYILSMIFVGFLEEIIFRGFLFNAMAENNLKSTIIVSSATFGIGHFVNLINGSGAELLPNICQVVSAVAIGFLFVALFYKTKSLWAPIIAHAVINSLSAFAVDFTNTQQIITSAVISVIAVLYGTFILRYRGKEYAEN